MKIISKYKDYYDYLSGIYGTDTKIILDRRTARKTSLAFYCDENSLRVRHLFICGKRIDFLQKGNTFFFGNELFKFDYRYEKNPSTDQTVFISDCNAYLHLQITKDLDNINSYFNCPIILLYKTLGISNHRWTFGNLDISENEIYRFPKLSELGISKFLPAKEIYLMLCDWCAAKEIHIAPLSDKEKIVSSGFDLKTSFRGKKKSQK